LRQLDGVSKLFGSFAALRQVTVDLEPGRCYVLIGENGAGKSTLLRILAGLLRPSFGTVKVFGDSNRRRPRPHRLHEPRSHALRRADRRGEPALLRSLYPGRPNCLRPKRCARWASIPS
jgi:ABC-type branched-subunit amino acid transport system ATPase component